MSGAREFITLRNWHGSVVFAVLVFSGLLFSLTRSRYPVETHHNIRIGRHVSAQQWQMTDDEDPQGFMYYACSDFENAEWIKEGYFAREAKWQVRGGCYSIRDQGLGFWYVWNNDIARTNKEMGYE